MLWSSKQPFNGHSCIFACASGAFIDLSGALRDARRQACTRLKTVPELARLLQRIYETFHVHKFSHATMPIFNLFKNCTYYWLFAAFVSYFTNHPLYMPPPLAWTVGCLCAAYCCQVCAASGMLHPWSWISADVPVSHTSGMQARRAQRAARLHNAHALLQAGLALLPAPQTV